DTSCDADVCEAQRGWDDGHHAAIGLVQSHCRPGWETTARHQYLAATRRHRIGYNGRSNNRADLDVLVWPRGEMEGAILGDEKRDVSLIVEADLVVALRRQQSGP